MIMKNFYVSMLTSNKGQSCTTQRDNTKGSRRRWFLCGHFPNSDYKTWTFVSAHWCETDALTQYRRQWFLMWISGPCKGSRHDMWGMMMLDLCCPKINMFSSSESDNIFTKYVWSSERAHSRAHHPPERALEKTITINRIININTSLLVCDCRTFETEPDPESGSRQAAHHISSKSAHILLSYVGMLFWQGLSGRRDLLCQWDLLGYIKNNNNNKKK